MADTRRENDRPIPTRAHGVIDYLVGVALVAAPWIFQFDDVGAAKWTAIAAGAAVLLTSAMTDYELGLVRAIPMPVHLVADGVVGAFLIASPWLFGFSDEGLNAWLPHVVVGVGEIGAALMTSRYPADRGRGVASAGRGASRRAA